mmetsp:Transcript_36358/g.54282  ORF Transcript_36358/g.54282 Transcript_36358/m.54282 type:complete len:258 (+) Transcript_36358:647-1420(+)
MGIMAPPSGILQTMPLCEVESFQTLQGDTGFGTSYSILATLRVVGRGSLVYIDQEEIVEGREYLTGWCTELCDDTCSESGRKEEEEEDLLVIGNQIADKLEDVFTSIVLLEEKLERLEEEDNDLFLDTYDIEDDDDDDDEDDDDEDSLQKRFEQVYQTVKATDMQGYRISSSSSPPNPTRSPNKKWRSVQDLTALSWSYFHQELWPEEEFDTSLSYRLKSMEIVNLNQRLRLALDMLMEYRSCLKETLKRERDDENF